MISEVGARQRASAVVRVGDLNADDLSSNLQLGQLNGLHDHSWLIHVAL